MTTANIARLDLARPPQADPAAPSDDGAVTPAPTTDPVGGDGRDREIAADIVAAVRTLNQAMDDAIIKGLIVEPSFSVSQGRFEDFGISADSYIANVKVFRKLC